MKCPMCKGMGTSNICVNGTFKTCAYCNGKGEVENLCDTCGTICPFDDEHSECENYTPQTNEGWLKSLNTEQLAEWIAKQKCDGCNDEPYDEKHGTCKYCITKKTEQIMEWLKQPHTAK